MAVVRLEAEQRIVITRHYGDSLRSSALFDGFEGFGADLLPLDRRRDDPHHRMNGETMWGYWFAFCDAAMRAARTQASVPIRFWQLVSRAALIGMMNDGIYRKRFTVKGFSEVPDDRGRIRSFVENLDDAGLSGEMFTRMRESGLIS